MYVVGDLLLEMNKIDSRILYFFTSCSKLLPVVLLKKFGLEKIEYVIPDGAYSCIYIDYLILKKKFQIENIIPGSFPNLIRHEITVSYPSNICKPSGFLYIFFFKHEA